MKKIITVLTLSLLTNSLYAHAKVDCISEVTKALSLASGQHIELKSGKTSEGLACELRVGYEKANSGITNQDYRTIDVTPFSIKKYSNDTLSEMYADMFAGVSDNTNGLDVYNIKKCEVSDKAISLKYSSHEINGWHNTKDYTINLALENGKIKAISARSNAGESSACRF